MKNKTNQKCDLHIHSIFSDSTEGIEDIFKKAREKGLSCIAVTDHDTVAGIPLAYQYSKLYHVELLEGIEMTAQKNGEEIHILGYGIDVENHDLQVALSQTKIMRKERLISMTDRLNALGLPVDRDEILLKVGDVIPTRLHMGLYLMEKGIVSNIWEAFKKYLSPGMPGYVPCLQYSVEEAIQCIKAWGGAAFLAHPFLLSDQSWIREFVKYGLDGLEVVYPRLSPAKISFYSELADMLGLLKSGGSDAHGAYKDFTDVGKVTISYDWVEEIKKCRKMPVL